MMDFKVERISKSVTRIYGICTELMYLIEGERCAALLDTGVGFGSLRKVVETLTDKPILVLLSHGHTDHAMGAGEFDHVYMNHKDDDIYRVHGEEDFRWEGVKLSEEYTKLEREDFIPTVPVEKFTSMSGGDVFDLGGKTLRVYNCPGHTKGTVVFLLEEERRLFLGDACNSNTFMYDEYSTTIAEYERSLQTLKEEVEGKYDVAYAFHGDGKLTDTIIDEVIDVCHDIMDGNTDDIPMTFRGTHGLIAKAIGDDRKRLDGKCGNIVYNKERIL